MPSSDDMPKVIITAILLYLTLVGLVVYMAFLVGHNQNRLDDLEARMTTFETVRIEYVAPASDSG